MAVINKSIASIVADYPAYMVVERETQRGARINENWDDEVEYIDIEDGDTLALLNPVKGYYYTYKAGSVVSYAMRDGRDPIEALDRARNNRHELHWLNLQGTIISAAPRAQEVHINITLDMVVRFEGRFFRVVKLNKGWSSDEHLKLVPYTMK